MIRYHPVFLDLRGRRCVVIGGGAVAQRKVIALVRAGAAVDVISPLVTRPLSALAARRAIRHVPRRFRAGDLAGAWLAYAATDDPAINAAVVAAASRRRIFVNVVDQPALCTFIAPAVLRRGTLAVAISTGGASPTLAKRLRSEIGRLIVPDYARVARWLRALREPAKRRLPGYRDRQRFFEALLDSPAIDQLRRGRSVQARRSALTLLARHAAARR